MSELDPPTVNPFEVDPDNPEEVLAADLAKHFMQFRESLIDVRHERDVPQQRLADLMHRNVSQVSRFEALDSDPRLSTVMRYAFAVGAEVRFKVTPRAVHGHGPVVSAFESTMTACIAPKVTHRQGGAQKWTVIPTLAQETV